MFVAWNAAAGPLTDNVRWKELRDIWTAYFRDHDWTNNSLFRGFFDQLYEYYGGENVFGTHGSEAKVWDKAKESPYVVGPAQKANMVRFWSSPGRAEEELPKWALAELNYTLLSLSQHKMSSAKVQKLVLPEKCNGDGGDMNTTDSTRHIYDEKNLKSTLSDGVSVATTMLQEHDHIPIVASILAWAGETKKWHHA